MTVLPYDELVKLIDAIGRSLSQRGDCVVVPFFDDNHPMKVVAYTRPDGYAMLRCRRPDRPDGWTRLQLGGGGGLGAPPDPALFQQILLHSGEFDWGGPFATYHRDGSITFGTQLSFPSTLVSQEDPRDAAHYIMEMIGMVGRTARLLASHALPRFGGTPLDGSAQSHPAALLAALMGPPPPDVAREL